MEQMLHDEVLRLTSELARIRQEHRVQKRALLAETRSKKDALQEWFDDEQARIEEMKAVMILRVASASQRLTSSSALQLELEPVTSSSPDDTMHLLAADHLQQPQQQQQQHHRHQSGMLALPERAHDAPSSGHCSHSHSAPDPADVGGHSDHPEHEAVADPELLSSGAGMTVPASSPAAESTDAEKLPDAVASVQPAEGGESYIEIDMTHVVPVTEQREAGTTTFMMCRPRHRRSEFDHTNSSHTQTSLPVLFASSFDLADSSRMSQSRKPSPQCFVQHIDIGTVGLEDLWLLTENQCSAAGKLPRAWPAGLWKPLDLEPVVAALVHAPQPTAQASAPVRLQTNDEALVENKDVANLVNVKDMTPEV